jgi:hypothetical protein
MSASQQVQTTRSALAVRILSLAARGERDPICLRAHALSVFDAEDSSLGTIGRQSNRVEPCQFDICLSEVRGRPAGARRGSTRPLGLPLRAHRGRQRAD